MFTRRQLLRLGAGGVLGLAGCATNASDRSEDPPSTLGSLTRTPTPRSTSRVTAAAEGSSSPAEGSTSTDTENSPTATQTETSPFQEDSSCSNSANIDNGGELTVEINPFEALSCRGRLLDPLNGLDGWEVIGGSAAATSDTVLTGSQSVEVTASPSDKRLGIKRQFARPIDLSRHNLSLGFNLESPEWEGINIELVAPDDFNTVVMKRGVWRAGWVRLDLGPRHHNGSPDLTQVEEIRISMYTGGGVNARFYVDSLRAVPRSPTGRAFLTFDDNHISQYETAFPTMESYGYQGMVAAIPWAEGPERIDVSGLSELQDAGWDIASHPQRDRSFREMPSADKQEAIHSSKQWLIENGFEEGARYLVWPYGRYDAESLQIARRHHYLGFTTDGSIFGPVTGPLTVSRVDGVEMSSVKSAIDLASQNGLNVAIYYHQIGETDPAISKGDFEETLSYLQSSNLNVVTPSDYLAEMDLFGSN